MVKFVHRVVWVGRDLQRPCSLTPCDDSITAFLCYSLVKNKQMKRDLKVLTCLVRFCWVSKDHSSCVIWSLTMSEAANINPYSFPRFCFETNSQNSGSRQHSFSHFVMGENQSKSANGHCFFPLSLLFIPFFFSCVDTQGSCLLPCIDSGTPLSWK